MSEEDAVSFENRDSAEVRSAPATEPPADLDLLSYLLASLPDRIGPERPLRYMPVALRAWSFFLRYCRDQDRREPRGASPYYCDRCRPAAAPAAVRRVEPAPNSQQSREPT